MCVCGENSNLQYLVTHQRCKIFNRQLIFYIKKQHQCYNNRCLDKKYIYPFHMKKSNINKIWYDMESYLQAYISYMKSSEVKQKLDLIV